MMKQVFSILAVIYFSVEISNAFSVVPSRHLYSSSLTTTTKTTTLNAPCCLYASAEDDAETSAASEEETTEEQKHDEPTDEDHRLPSENGSDILNSPEFLKRKIDVLKSDIEKADETITELDTAVEASKAEWGDQLDSLQKEYENINNRLSEQSSKGDVEATIQVARKMLEVIDNYDRAFQAVTPSSDEETSIEASYKTTYDKFLKIFSKMGINEVETVGSEFDYNLHSAVMTKPSDEYEEGIVSEELQKGYILDDKLIRAAMVVVAA